MSEPTPLRKLKADQVLALLGEQGVSRNVLDAFRDLQYTGADCAQPRFMANGFPAPVMRRHSLVQSHLDALAEVLQELLARPADRALEEERKKLLAAAQARAAATSQPARHQRHADPSVAPAGGGARATAAGAGALTVPELQGLRLQVPASMFADPRGVKASPDGDVLRLFHCGFEPDADSSGGDVVPDVVTTVTSLPIEVACERLGVDPSDAEQVYAKFAEMAAAARDGEPAFRVLVNTRAGDDLGGAGHVLHAQRIVRGNPAAAKAMFTLMIIAGGTHFVCFSVQGKPPLVQRFIPDVKRLWTSKSWPSAGVAAAASGGDGGKMSFDKFAITLDFSCSAGSGGDKWVKRVERQHPEERRMGSMGEFTVDIQRERDDALPPGPREVPERVQIIMNRARLAGKSFAEFPNHMQVEGQRKAESMIPVEIEQRRVKDEAVEIGVFRHRHEHELTIGPVRVYIVCLYAEHDGECYWLELAVPRSMDSERAALLETFMAVARSAKWTSG